MIVPAIRDALDAEMDAVREIFREYESSVGAPVCFGGFEQELAGLPAPYAPPRGALLVADGGKTIAGTITLRPIDVGTGEMKRLYVRPAFRATGLGRCLAESLIARAREIGYGALRLDTLPSMGAAQALYRSLGFRRIAPYREVAIPGVVFMELRLIPSPRPGFQRGA